eukprot:CAMPEP_0176132544 /NCGR_PEP_ID=MMETSP0120_2-20121206/67146_1 /TAXON_ID=160619 /ORGANISM="Kryptoperidinium foliaceum, Strain CCMP 1326" /LENGTH=43 /DNA_ID= /DNA_START= /DNA_END= /DNA_ORIENTATION=
MAQQAAVLSMPFAIAVAADAEFGDLPKFRDVAFYWWKPDTTFI